MNDPVSMARTARERLAQGLGALQSPGVPPQILDVAEPVAKAMSALHRIEAARGSNIAEIAPQALDAVRRSLAGLQTYVGQHPAVDHAIEAVASSLNLVHQLSTRASTAPAAGNDLAFAGTMVADAGNFPAPQQQAAPAVQQPHAQPRQQYAQPAPQQYAQPAAQPYAQPAPQQYAPPPQHYAQPAQQAASQRYPAAQPPAFPPQSQPLGQTAPSAQAAHPSPAAVVTSDSGMLRVDAELGAHSATNFYKGLSGNDIVDSGGIFIATYQVPKMGTPVLIHISMPGGYEFQAKGVVKWTRETPQSSIGGTHAPPGFGAQFTEISPESRQLVYRYVRNREPLFHDDL